MSAGTVIVTGRIVGAAVESTTLLWFKSMSSLVVLLTDSDTFPLKPFTLAMVMVDVADWPAWMTSGTGDADAVKSVKPKDAEAL